MRLLPLLLLTACSTRAPEDGYDSSDLWAGLDAAPDDVDEDGSAADVDCDDLDASTHPGAEERCGDGLDNDCENGIDDGCPGGGATSLTETSCDNAADDDGDQLRDCEDDDCAGAPECAVCLRDQTAFCGMDFNNQPMWDATSDVSGYADSGGGEGAEEIFAFEPLGVATTYTITFRPDSGISDGWNAALHLMEGNCRPERATATVDANGKGGVETMTFTVPADESWYVAAERTGGSGNGFRVQITCP